jgi:hypothetical protein
MATIEKPATWVTATPEPLDGIERLGAAEGFSLEGLDGIRLLTGP